MIKLEPDETRRRFYTRIFKWVVAYASWKFGGVRASLREGTGAGECFELCWILVLQRSLLLLT